MATIDSPSVQARLKEIGVTVVAPERADLGGTVLPGSPADFGKLIVEETEKWGKVIRGGQYQGGVTQSERLGIP